MGKPVEQDTHGQLADPGSRFEAPAAGDLLGQYDPDLTQQVAHPFQQEPIDRIPTGRTRLGLVLLPVARLDPEPPPVQPALPHRLLMDALRPVAAPTAKGEDHRPPATLPEEGPRLHLSAGPLGLPLGPADQPVPPLEEAVAGVGALTGVPQRDGVGQAALLQQQEHLAAVKAAVEDYTPDFQAFFGDLLQQGPN